MFADQIDVSFEYITLLPVIGTGYDAFTLESVNKRCVKFAGAFLTRIVELAVKAKTSAGSISNTVGS
jgi:hypothetical protein